jgi:hypothetical protein
LIGLMPLYKGRIRIGRVSRCFVNLPICRGLFRDEGGLLPTKR